MTLAIRAGRLKLSEADVVRQITDLMKAEGWRCMRLQSGLFVSETRILRVGEKGLPDWLFLRAGQKGAGWAQCLFVEIKGTGKKPKPDQLAWLADATTAGLLATWTDNLDTFRGWMRTRGLHPEARRAG